MIKRNVAATALWLVPHCAYAHGIDERHNLPAPLAYFIAGATAAVAVSFVIALLFARAAPRVSRIREMRIGALPVLRAGARALGLLLFVTTLAAGLYGTRDPVMNLAPTLVWIVWWVGLTVFVGCIGNVWPAIDPWRTLYDLIDFAVRRAGVRRGATLGLPYPHGLDAWPAAALLLFIGWFEVVYPEGAEPRRIASAMLAWTAITLAGHVLFGPAAWRRNGDVFSIYFCTLGRFAPFARGTAKTLRLRVPGRGLLAAEGMTLGRVGFVVAMLAIVLFDGLLSGETWYVLQAQVMRDVPALANPRGAIAGATGLAALWLLLFAAYAIACALAAKLVRGASTLVHMKTFALTLVPIAIGYAVAHNASHLVAQGQHAIALVSDPLGRQWNLFGTAGYRAAAVMGPKSTWYVAVSAIVIGHAISIWLAHRVALREFGAARLAALACVPLTVVMLVYTATSLAIIAEPMVRFEPVRLE
ncbi:MAG TPA: hypothetical protein VHP37_13205 [Burkholderiales bacterium]|nr:hypothetical protein [Burkholderiales bacterium]